MKKELSPQIQKEDWDEINDLRMQAQDNFSERNKEKLREIERVIVSAVIISKDGKILMGKKDPSKGGSYPDDWHIPGGGVEQGQTMEEALRDEIMDEIGLDISQYTITELPFVDYDETEKLDKKTGERVWAKMEFHRFEIRIDLTADEIKVTPSSELPELHWFSKPELSTVKQAATGKIFFRKAGYMDAAEDPNS